MKRARELGMEELIPSKWKEKSVDSEAITDSDETDFLASLMEFEMISTETDIDKI
jgi:hypothetical protein